MALRKGITAAIPSIPTRTQTRLHRALDSVTMQQQPVDEIMVRSDTGRLGAAANRNGVLAQVDTEWVAFLDDDDAWYPDHIKLLAQHAEETGADMIYPWFDVENGFDPWPGRESLPFDPVLLDTQNTIPVTVLARTELLRDVGGFRPKGPPDNPCDDWGAWLALRDAGAKIEHLNRRTWVWVWHIGNTSGRGDKW